VTTSCCCVAGTLTSPPLALTHERTTPHVRAAAYIRVSSKSQTLDMQRAAIERAARARRDSIVEWYSDKQSARTLSRPGLENLRQAAREGRVPRLYVYRLDRLARSGIRDTFRGDRRAAPAPLCSSPSPTASTSILAAQAMTASTTSAAGPAAPGHQRADRRRLRPPRGGGSLSPLEKTRIAALRRKGATIREIAIAVGAPRATIARALSQNVPPVPAHGAPARRRAAVAGRK